METVPAEFTSRWLEERYAARYLEFTAPVEPDPAEWISRLRIGSSSTVIDLGCGEAKILTSLSSSIRSGIGIDASPHMLGAGRKYASRREAGNVQLVRADFRHLPLHSSSGDAAFSNAALHHVPNEGKSQCLAELCRVLRPGALFHLRDDTFNFAPEDFEELEQDIYREWEQEFGTTGWAFLRDQLAGADFECTPFTTDLLALLQAAGFEILESAPSGLVGVRILARSRAAG
ncbi:MAG: class I SAM-dependent methyltransferase [bacterium]|nr:class I SAM-dependent methyltransferase [bacterium]MCP5065848.1 class I SAM-dependent methyltransferase [bacterium]